YWDAMIGLYGTSDSLQLVDSIAKYYGSYYDLPPSGTAAYYDAVANYGSGDQFILGWDDAFWACGGTPGIYLWCYNSSYSWDYHTAWRHPDQVGACFSWEAADYDDLTFPNPTLNGLLPDMTSTDWKEDIYDTPSDWSQGDCDTTYIDF
ncbi:MAG: hypothetical protein V3T31_05340, partial [candidate division Zixibacteria bacterium]